MKNFTWEDTDEIAKTLSEKYPDTPPVVLSKDKLREKVIALEGFNDASQPRNDIYITAIRSSWIMLWHGDDAERSFYNMDHIRELEDD